MCITHFVCISLPLLVLPLVPLLCLNCPPPLSRPRVSPRFHREAILNRIAFGSHDDLHFHPLVRPWMTWLRYVHSWIQYVCIQNIFSIRSSVGGRQGWFCDLAIVNNALRLISKFCVKKKVSSSMRHWTKWNRHTNWKIRKELKCKDWQLFLHSLYRCFLIMCDCKYV